MPPTATAALLAALALDAAFGEPPERLHPVALFGAVVEGVSSLVPTRHQNRYGVGVALVMPLGAAAMASGATWIALEVSVAAGVVVAGTALFTATSLRRLLTVGREVIYLSVRDLGESRRELKRLVGRDTADLGEAGVRSAALESLAENLADGLVAPLTAFAVLAPFSLPLGVGGAVWVKAVNTLDSMLGYRSNPLGGASARLDDLVVWVPARLTAALIVVAALDPGAFVGARRWSGEPRSPNSGWPMAALACVLDVRLEKQGEYVLNPGVDLPSESVARRGVVVVAVAGLLMYLCVGVTAWL